MSEAADWAEVFYGNVELPDLSEEKAFLTEALAALPSGMFDLETWSAWTGELKAKTGRKGRGLFMPLRQALTGRERGPEMNRVIVLLGEDRTRQRLHQALS